MSADPASEWHAFPRSEVSLPKSVTAAFDAFLKKRHPKATQRRLDVATADLSEAFTEAIAAGSNHRVSNRLAPT